MNGPSKAVTVAKLRAEWEAGRLPLPHYIAALQRIGAGGIASETSRNVAVMRTVRAKSEVGEWVAKWFPYSLAGWLALAADFALFRV